MHCKSDKPSIIFIIFIPLFCMYRYLRLLLVDGGLGFVFLKHAQYIILAFHVRREPPFTVEVYYYYYFYY